MSAVQNVNVLQIGRILLKVRHRFQDHVILIRLREQGRDLALPESVVEVWSIACGVIPSREAVTRSITSVVCAAPFC